MGDNLQRQPLALNQGEYTIITVGNMSERSAHEHGEDSILEQFGLRHVAEHDPLNHIYTNSDELFWGVKRFAVDSEGRGLELPCGRAATNRLLTPVNNIHCHLKVKVEWENLPPYIGDYEMELDGVASAHFSASRL